MSSLRRKDHLDDHSPVQGRPIKAMKSVDDTNWEQFGGEENLMQRFMRRS